MPNLNYLKYCGTEQLYVPLSTMTKLHVQNFSDSSLELFYYLFSCASPDSLLKIKVSSDGRLKTRVTRALITEVFCEGRCKFTFHVSQLSSKILNRMLTLLGCPMHIVERLMFAVKGARTDETQVKVALLNFHLGLEYLHNSPQQSFGKSFGQTFNKKNTIEMDIDKTTESKSVEVGETSIEICVDAGCSYIKQCLKRDIIKFLTNLANQRPKMKMNFIRMIEEDISNLQFWKPLLLRILNGSLNFQPIVSLIKSDIPVNLWMAIKFVRKLLILSVQENQLDKFVRIILNNKMLVRIVNALSYMDYPSILFEASWCLTNISSCSDELALKVLNKTYHHGIGSVISATLKCMKTVKSEPIIRQCSWIFGNLAAGSTEARDILLKYDVMPALLRVLQHSNKTTLTTTVWAISCLCYNKYNNRPDWNKVKICVIPLINLLNKVCESKEDEIIKTACTALSYLCNDDNVEIVNYMVKYGVLSVIRKLLGMDLSTSTK